MKSDYFKVIRGGLNSTFQDQGRKNLYHIGIPFSGAMDQRNFLIANKKANFQTQIAKKQKEVAESERERAENERKNAENAREESENRRKKSLTHLILKRGF